MHIFLLTNLFFQKKSNIGVVLSQRMKLRFLSFLTESCLKWRNESEGESGADRDALEVLGDIHMSPPHEGVVVNLLNVVTNLDGWDGRHDRALLDPLDERVPCPVVSDRKPQRILRLGHLNLLLRPLSMDEYEIVQTKLGGKEAVHVHSVGIQGAKQDLFGFGQ